MTPGSAAAMNSFNFRKRWKYFGQSPAIVSLKPSCYPFLPDNPNPDLPLPQKEQAKAVITSGLNTQKMKGGFHEKSIMDDGARGVFSFIYLQYWPGKTI
jgi:hypothetical protein